MIFLCKPNSFGVASLASSIAPFSSQMLKPSFYPIHGYFCFPVQSDFLFLASFLQGWEYTSVWELMPWFTAQLHEKQTEGPGCLLIRLSSTALLPCLPDSVTSGSEHMGKGFLHSHLWPISEIYCIFLQNAAFVNHTRNRWIYGWRNVQPGLPRSPCLHATLCC